MHLLVGGFVKFNKKNADLLLFTDTSIFVIKNKDDMPGDVGGLVGIAAVAVIKKVKGEKGLPEYFNDSEMSLLDDKTIKSLIDTNLLIKIPLNNKLKVTATMLGFVFEKDQIKVSYKALVNKKKISLFLKEHQVMIL